MKWFENSDMEHIMDTCTQWKSETICHFTYVFRDLERAGVMRTELAARSRIQGTHVVIKKA